MESLEFVRRHVDGGKLTMFDFIIEIPPEFCYGVIDRIGLDNFFVTPESYAPGVWCGGEKMILEVRAKNGMVMGELMTVSIGLDTRSVGFILRSGRIELGYELYRKG